ncbi:MAG: phytoene desaturase family protein, partial [Pyrinomonadaceae bacterium]
MNYEVVVVGGGIGGLTVAALLAARGLNVCLFERQHQLGGCAARVEIAGHDFEPGIGFYTGWGATEIHARIFAELGSAAPETQRAHPYYVRQQDGRDIQLFTTDDEFHEELRSKFPDCAADAITLYQTIDASLKQSKKAASGTLRSLLHRKSNPTFDISKSIASYLEHTSSSFRRFIDAQLRAVVGVSSESCPFGVASVALARLRANSYSIIGGPASVADRLAESFKKSGGTLQLNTPVLRIAYNDREEAVGVDLLSGERVTATRAIISNMTIWDTYGKLIGLRRTPADVKKRLSQTIATGAYLIYASMERGTSNVLPGDRFLVSTKGTVTDFTFCSTVCTAQA